MFKAIKEIPAILNKIVELLKGLTRTKEEKKTESADFAKHQTCYSMRYTLAAEAIRDYGEYLYLKQKEGLSDRESKRLNHLHYRLTYEEQGLRKWIFSTEARELFGSSITPLIVKMPPLAKSSED